MQERAEITRRSLLEAAARLFDERGYAETSISDIGALSGHSSGAIYFHYTSKEKLARAVVEEHAAMWPTLIDKHVTGEAPALQRLVCLSFAVARAFRDNRMVRAGTRLWAERAVVTASLPSPYTAWLNAAAELLTQARKEGDIAAHIDLPGAAKAIVWALFGSHAMSDVLHQRQAVENHLTDLWLLLLPALQDRSDGFDATATLDGALALLQAGSPAPAD